MKEASLLAASELLLLFRLLLLLLLLPLSSLREVKPKGSGRAVLIAALCRASKAALAGDTGWVGAPEVEAGRWGVRLPSLALGAV